MWGLFAETVLRVGSNSRVQEKKADPPQFSGMQLLELDLFIEQGKEILILPSRAVLTTAYLLPAQYLARFLRTPEQTNEFWNKHPSNQDDRGLSAEVLLVDLNLDLNRLCNFCVCNILSLYWSLDLNDVTRPFPSHDSD